MDDKNDKCYFCDCIIYVKTVRHYKSLLAPLTIEEELRQKLEDMTGEAFLPVEHLYCPMCGKKIKREAAE